MSRVDLEDFRSVANTLLKADVLEFKQRQKLEINKLLLGQFLIDNMDRFRRSVTQSEKELIFRVGVGRHYNVRSDIGYLNGRRFFFEIVNPEVNAVNIYCEKRGTKTSPPTVILCKLNNRRIRQIVDHLISSNFKNSSSSNSDILDVPDGVYVFEFTAQVGPYKRERITAPPFKAENVDDAIRIFRLCPFLPRVVCLYSFRFCTKDGWQRLRHELPPHTIPGHARVIDYILTLP